MNWADYKHPVNSEKPDKKGNSEPSQRSTREGVETGHGATQTCSRCEQEKPLSEFYKKDAKTGRKDSTCKACRIIRQREKHLGITNDEYWRLYHLQGGRCGICRRRMYSKRYKRFAVDHDHETGKIRGLLCHSCNRALGMFRDCPMALRRAIDWVEGTVRSSWKQEQTE